MCILSGVISASARHTIQCRIPLRQLTNLCNHRIQHRTYSLNPQFSSAYSKYLPSTYTTPPSDSSSIPHSTYPSTTTPSPLIHTFFDEPTSTWTYLVVDTETYQTLIIDPVLDYDPVSGDVQTTSVKKLLGFVKDSEYLIRGIVETHVHADHLSGAFALKTALGGDTPILIGRRVKQVQETFAKVYGFLLDDFEGVFDEFLEDEGSFKLGSLKVETFPLPGHTPDSMGLLIGDSLFAGDSIFLPDVGSARVDFPGGNAKALYQSVQRILNLPPNTRVFSGHDYPVGRDRSCMVTVADQAKHNKHLNIGTSLESFTRMREERDAVLGTPRLLHAALQFNLRGGRLPPPDEHGQIYVRTPLKGETMLAV